jgi:hypothetical protein
MEPTSTVLHWLQINMLLVIERVVSHRTAWQFCYVTAGTFTRRGLSRLPYDKTQVQGI